MANNQRVAKTALSETGSSGAVNVQFSTSALSPSVGSISQTPNINTTLIAVDYQVASFAFSVGSGVSAVATLTAPIGLTGFFQPTQRYYSGSTPPASVGVVPTNTQSMTVSQSTQLLLVCELQNYTVNSSVGLPILSAVSFQTLAFENQMNTSLKGPWFPSGTTYLAFSVSPSLTIFNPSGSAVTGTIKVGFSALLYGMNIQ